MLEQSRESVEDSETKQKILKGVNTLRSDIQSIMHNDFNVKYFAGLTISQTVLIQVISSALQAMNDMRHVYPNSISLIKYISNTAFWIVKLKPVNCNMVIKNIDGKDVRITDDLINEKIAIYWALKKLLSGIKKGRLREIINNDEKSIYLTKKTIQYYMNNNIYKKISTGEEVPSTTKYRETIHYFRFKKITAIYVYEILMHLIVAQNASSYVLPE